MGSRVVWVNQSVWEGRETLAVFLLFTHKPVVLVSFFVFYNIRCTSMHELIHRYTVYTAELVLKTV